jgi:hypothetical protein
MRDHPFAHLRPVALAGGLEHYTGDVLSRAPSWLRSLQEERLTPVDRERLDRDDDLISAGPRLINLRESHGRQAIRSGDQGSHVAIVAPWLSFRKRAAKCCIHTSR